MTKQNEEQKIQKRILNFLYNEGYIAVKYNNLGIYATAGFPDIVACSPKGRFVAIEVKVPGEKPKTHQEAYLKAINELNGIGFSATSVEDVKIYLKKYEI